MEFTGSIQFADESSWLTLTTESDDTVTITVKFGSRIISSKEVLSFDVTPNSGIVRLPAGEILRALMGNGIGMVTGSFTATQGSSSCSYSFSVLPCRKFAYKSLAATIFTTRPAASPVYKGAGDRLYFYRTSGDVSTYVRFNYLAGDTSSSYKLSPTYYVSGQYYDLDVSADTMLATASAKGLSVSNIASYDVWIEYSGSTSTVYSFDIKRMRLPLKTYKFLGRRGTYEYIHATGKFSRSIESETQVFVNSGIEQELENDYSMTFEQNSGHIDSIGMNGYWLEFLAAKERYIIEKDGSERAIVVDEFKTSLTDRAVSSLTFTWHYANPNNTVISNADVALTSLSITGSSSVSNANNEARFGVTYSPSNTTQRGVTWSIASGSDYASIDQNGLLTVKNGASGNTVKIRATSKGNTSLYADKSVTVTYKAAAVAVTGVTLSKTVLSLSIGDSETLVATVVPERATDKSLAWSSSAPSIASVDQNGKVTAKAAGTAVITVKTNDGSFTARCNLSVAAVLKYYTLTVNCTTSGATVKVLEYVAGQTSIKDAVDYTGPMTFKENTTVKVWCHKNGMIDSSTQTILMTSDKTANVACKSYPSWNLGSSVSHEAASGSIIPVVSDPDTVGWSLKSDVSWITINNDGTGFVVATNSSTDSRIGNVSLACDANETGEKISTCTITQSGVKVMEPSIEFGFESVEVTAATTEITRPFTYANLAELNINVSGDLENADAIITIGTETTFTVNFSDNTSASPRTGTITITGTRVDGLGIYSKSFTLIQASMNEDSGVSLLGDGFLIGNESGQSPWLLIPELMDVADETFKGVDINGKIPADGGYCQIQIGFQILSKPGSRGTICLFGLYRNVEAALSYVNGSWILTTFDFTLDESVQSDTFTLPYGQPIELSIRINSDKIEYSLASKDGDIVVVTENADVCAAGAVILPVVNAEAQTEGVSSVDDINAVPSSGNIDIGYSYFKASMIDTDGNKSLVSSYRPCKITEGDDTKFGLVLMDENDEEPNNPTVLCTSCSTSGFIKKPSS